MPPGTSLVGSRSLLLTPQHPEVAAERAARSQCAEAERVGEAGGGSQAGTTLWGPAGDAQPLGSDAACLSPTEQDVRFRPAGWPLPRPTAIHHIVEDFLTDWTAPVNHILPLRRFLENCLDTDLRSFYAGNWSSQGNKGAEPGVGNRPGRSRRWDVPGCTSGDASPASIPRSVVGEVSQEALPVQHA